MTIDEPVTLLRIRRILTKWIFRCPLQLQHAQFKFGPGLSSDGRYQRPVPFALSRSKPPLHRRVHPDTCFLVQWERYRWSRAILKVLSKLAKYNPPPTAQPLLAV